jgi:aldose sugar dehydrogenase
MNLLSLVVIAVISSAQLQNYHSASDLLSDPPGVQGPVLNDPTLNAQVVFQGVKFPTSMAFLDHDDILVLEKNEGTVKRIVNGTMLSEPVLDVNVANQAERGMLGIAIKKLENGTTYVFIYYTEAKSSDGDEPVGNRVYRYELINGRLVNPKLLLDLPAIPRPVHNGGKIIVGPGNSLFLTIGDLKSYGPQTDEVLNGTSGILRITQEGLPVSNDGILDNKVPLNLYYAYGIRNSFGMDFDPMTGRLWDTENGPEYGDEINLVEPGFNSGWEKIQGIWSESSKGSLIKASDKGHRDLADFNGKAKYSPPELTFFEEPGVTALKFLNSNKLGEKYENDIFVGGFHNGIIYDLDLTKDRNELFLEGELEDKVADNNDEPKEIIFGKGFGGITDIQVGPDGYLYVLSLYQGGNDCPQERQKEENSNSKCIPYSSNLQGTIFRIMPAK